MPRWTIQAYQEYEDRCKKSAAKPQRTVRVVPLAAPSEKEKNPARFFIRITSFRVRPIDPDNLCAKFHIDCLRYSGIIPDDSARIVDLWIWEKEASDKTAERTEIEISKITDSSPSANLPKVVSLPDPPKP